MTKSNLTYLVRQTFKEWQEDNASRLAAALAYYTIFSIPPLLIIAIAIAAQIFDQTAVQQQITNQMQGLIGDSGAQVVEAILENSGQAGESVLATIISVVTLLLGASGVFGELHSTLNAIWEVQARPGRGILGTIKDRFFSFTMVLGVGFLLLVSLVVSAGLAAVNEFITGALPGVVILAQAINFLVSFGIITVLFALVFKVVPDVRIAWRDVWVGAVVTAFLFTIGKFAIGLYLGNSAPGSTYGAAGSLIVLLLWVYYSAQILFLGAEFTQVYANKFGSHIVADADAIPMTAEAFPLPKAMNEQATAVSASTLQPVQSPAIHTPIRRTVARNGRLSPTWQSVADGVNIFHHYTVQILAALLAIWQFATGPLTRQQEISTRQS